MRAHGCFQIGGENTRFNDRDCIRKTDFLDAVHLNQRESDSAAGRNAPAYVTKPAASRCYRNFLAGRKLKKFAYIICRPWEDNDSRFVRSEPFVAAMRCECVWIVSNDFVAKISQLRCRGDGKLGSFACAALQPFFEKVLEKSVPLKSLPLLGDLLLRDIRVAVADTVDLTIDFGSGQS